MNWTNNPLVTEPIFHDDFEVELIKSAFELAKCGDKLYFELKENAKEVREVAVFQVAYIYYVNSLPKEENEWFETPEGLFYIFNAAIQFCNRSLPLVNILQRKGFPTINEENFTLTLLRTRFIYEEFNSFIEKNILGV